MIPATWAVVSASPFGKSPSLATVSGAMRTTARATARRRTIGFPPTSTMWTLPVSSTCESSLTRRRLDGVEIGEQPVEPDVDVVVPHLVADAVAAAPALAFVHRE